MPEKDAVMVHLEYIKEGIDDLKKQNNEQFGRINTLEKDMGVVQDNQKKSFGRTVLVGIGTVLTAIAAIILKWVVMER